MSKIERILFQLTIFLIPTNLAYHWVTKEAYVNGILVDYLIPKLYLSDLPILLLLLLWFLKLTSRLGQLEQLEIRKFFPPLLLTTLSLLLLLRAFLTPAPLAATWFWLKFVELTLFFLWIKVHVVRGEGNQFSPIVPARLPALLNRNHRVEGVHFRIFSWPGALKASLASLGKSYSYQIAPLKSKKMAIPATLNPLVTPLLLSLLLQSTLALYQFAFQKSLVGYPFFGEPNLKLTSNIAKTVVGGAIKIIPYGTTPHPNVLAGFLAIGIITIFLASRENGQMKPYQKYLIPISLLPTAYSLILTQSLSAWIALLLAVIAIGLTNPSSSQRSVLPKLGQLGIRSIRTIPAIIAIISFTIIASLFAHPYSLVANPSISRRLQLTTIALNMFRSSPFVGVGLNNFTKVMPYFGTVTANVQFLQPVHNLYLLYLAETGLVGTVPLIYFAWKKRQEIERKLSISNWQFAIPLMMILIIGAADHYPLTLQTGQLLLVFTAGLMLPKSYKI